MMRVLLAAALLGALIAGPLPAQGAPADAERAATDAVRQIRSPYCPGLMLEVCPSEPADALRDSIRGMARAGMTSGEIIEDVLARYGEEWRAVPLRRGAGLWAWVIPPLALLMGALFLVLRLRAMREARGPAAAEPAPGAGAPADPGLTDEDRERLDEALRALETEEAET